MLTYDVFGQKFGLRARRIFCVAFLRLEKMPHFNYAWGLKNYFNSFWLTFDICLVSTIMVVIRIGAPNLPTALFIIRPHIHCSNSTPQKNRVLKLPNEQVSFPVYKHQVQTAVNSSASTKMIVVIGRPLWSAN